MFANSGDATPPCGVPRVAFFPPLIRRCPRSSVSSTGAFSHILMRCSIFPSLTRRATHRRSAECGIVWLVGTGLGTIAFAEPCQSGPFRDRGLTEPAWRLAPVPPLRTRRADFPHRAPQVALATRPSDSRMTGHRVWQLEPRAAPEIAPVQPMSLAASAQHSDPLQLDLMPDGIEFWLAVMEPEVLIEPSQRHRQMALLVPPLPVPMPGEPLFGACKKLATALPARETNHRERAAAVRSAYMREAQKVERVRPLAICRLGLSGEASEEQQPRLLVGQLQIESREPLPQVPVEALRVPLILEARHEIIGKPNQRCLAPKPPPHLLLEPQVEDKVQIHVSQEWAERTTLRGPLLRADDDAALHDAGPEPFANQAQDDPVCNAVRHHSHQP